MRMTPVFAGQLKGSSSRSARGAAVSTRISELAGSSSESPSMRRDGKGHRGLSLWVDPPYYMPLGFEKVAYKCLAVSRAN